MSSSTLHQNQTTPSRHEGIHRGAIWAQWPTASRKLNVHELYTIIGYTPQEPLYVEIEAELQKWVELLHLRLKLMVRKVSGDPSAPCQCSPCTEEEIDAFRAATEVQEYSALPQEPPPPYDSIQWYPQVQFSPSTPRAGPSTSFMVPPIASIPRTLVTAYNVLGRRIWAPTRSLSDSWAHHQQPLKHFDSSNLYRDGCRGPW